MVDKIDYRYHEDTSFKEIKDYIDATYSQHYTTDTNIQALDMWEALGSLLTSSRDVAIKYLCRVGKKGTAKDARQDVLKVIHYCIFILYAMDKKAN